MHQWQWEVNQVQQGARKLKADPDSRVVEDVEHPVVVAEQVIVGHILDSNSVRAARVVGWQGSGQWERKSDPTIITTDRHKGSGQYVIDIDSCAWCPYNQFARCPLHEAGG